MRLRSTRLPGILFLGAMTAIGCGGSKSNNNTPDASPPDGAVITPDAKVITPDAPSATFDAAIADGATADGATATADASADGATATADATTFDVVPPPIDACGGTEFLGCTDASTATFCSAGQISSTSCTFGCSANAVQGDASIGGCNQECDPSAPGTYRPNCLDNTTLANTCLTSGLLDTTFCYNGCHMSGDTSTADVCETLVPSNLAADSCTPASAQADVFYSDTGGGGAPTEYTINTSNANTAAVDQPPNGCTSTQTQTNGPTICVVEANDLFIDANVIVHVTGTRPIAFLAIGSANVSGTIDAAANLGTAGPGGDAAQSSAGTGGTPTCSGLSCVSGGGGGGGYGLNAASSGGGDPNVAPAVTGGVAGASWGSDTLVPLIGGAAGGTNGASLNASVAGAGGGAVEIVGCNNVFVDTTGIISAGGGGGGGGPASAASSNGGAGGGSGGAVLLEGGEVDFLGGLFANGGGGGEGGIKGVGTASGQDGSNANLSTTPAPGGALTSAGDGGPGAVFGVDAKPAGANAPSGSDAAGGGGGAVGRAHINVRSGYSPDFSGAVMSPDPSSALGTITVTP